MAVPFESKTLYDALGPMPGGVNLGLSPLSLPPTVLSGAINTTVTGENITHRPCYQNRPVTYPSDGGVTKGRVQQGQFQGQTETVCLDDDGNAWIIALISGRVFSFAIGQSSANSVSCAELPIYSGVAITGGSTSGGSVTGPATVQPQAWLWQSELWVIIQDGVANPIVVNLNTQIAVRSAYGTVTHNSTTLANSAAVAPIGQNFTQLFTAVTNLASGSGVYLSGTGTFVVVSVGSLSAGSYPVVLQTVTGNGSTVSGGYAYWQSISATGIPPGRMGAYGTRNWMALAAANQFIALDLVGGASGTPTYNYRDAVLYSTENTYIVGGGTFCVPGKAGAITAMKFMTELDVALGQGPLLVFTSKSAWTCQAPVDRLTWQSLNSPLLTESLITNGAQGQWPTVNFNSDMIFRSVDGMRSWLTARLEDGAWGNPPISFELNPIFNLDDEALLQFGSSIVFGNRHLTTVGPVQSAQGVYFTGLAPLNAYPTSSLRGKAPAVWDSGTWVGSGSTSQMQILQMAVGEVNDVERAFALVLNTTASPNQIEFWEILSDGEATADNDGTNDIPIQWQFDSSSLRFGIPKNAHVAQYLSNGEIWIDDLIGTVSFSAFYKADQFPVFSPWVAWQQQQTNNASNSQPAFLPRAGLGEPSGAPLDFSTNRPRRQGFTFQFRLVVVGHCVFLGAFFESQTVPIPKFAPVIRSPL